MSLTRIDLLNFFTKTNLVRLSEKCGNTARKSWMKDKIISTFDDFSVHEIVSQCTDTQLKEFLDHHDQTVDNSQSTKEQVLQLFDATPTTPLSSSTHGYLPVLPMHCGHMNTEGAQFCSTCGKALLQDTEVYLKYWACKWWQEYVEGAFENFEDIYGDVYELMSDAGFGYGAHDLQSLEWIRFEKGQFVEFDDEGGVFTFVAHKIASNQESYGSTQSEGYNYETLRWYQDGFYGPSPKDLQALMYRTVERDTLFVPSVKLSINQQLLTTVNAQWRTLSKEEFTKRLCEAIVYVEGSVRFRQIP